MKAMLLAPAIAIPAALVDSGGAGTVGCAFPQRGVAVASVADRNRGFRSTSEPVLRGARCVGRRGLGAANGESRRRTWGRASLSVRRPAGQQRHGGVEFGGRNRRRSLARVGLFGIGAYVFFFTAGAPGGDAWHPLDVLVRRGGGPVCVRGFLLSIPRAGGYGPQFVWLDSGVFRRAQGVFYEASTLGNFCVFFLVMIAVA